MPMKPHKGESKDDFISRCMSETFTGDRTQEQALAICHQYWRDKDKEASMTKTKRNKTEANANDAPYLEDGETESEYVDRCVTELQDEFDDLDDSIAEDICYQAFASQEESMKPDKVKVVKVKRDKSVVDELTPEDCSSPESGETYQEYVDRCSEELLNEFDGTDLTTADAVELCESRAESENLSEESLKDHNKKRNKPGLTVFKTHAETVNGVEFVLSDETADRMGDIITADGWDLENFAKNPIALFNHRSDFPIGKWHNLRVDKKALKGHLELAPEGTSERIDEIRRLMKAGILKAVSVGFRPIEMEPLDKDAGPWGPQKFIKQELVETSLVSVPANPNALAVAKSLNVSQDTIDFVFAEHGAKDTRAVRLEKTGEHAVASRRPNRRRGAMTLAQRIIDAQARVNEVHDQLEAHIAKLDDTNVSDKDLETTNELNAKLAQERKTLATLQDTEHALAGTTAENGTRRRAVPAVRPTVLHNDQGNGNSRTQEEKDAIRQQLFAAPGEKLKPLDYLVRAGVVTYLSKIFGRNPEDVRTKIPGYNDEQTKAACELIIRAATNPAMTTVTGWAAELVTQINAAFMGLLMPNSVYPRLSAAGLSLSFGRAGRISVPTRSATPTIAGSFVGEGMPIPVRQGAFTAQILTPKKMAVITTWTREIDEHSIPAIEGLLRDAIQEDTAVAIDSVLMDANPATVIRPAGLLNGVAALTATTGGGFAAIVGDLKQLTSALTTATRGNVRSPRWLMNPGEINSAKLTVGPNSGEFPFKAELTAGNLLGYPVIDSGTVPPKTVVLVDAADFVSAGGDAPRFEVSDQATLHEEDTNPLPINSGTPATPIRSLWQTDSLALRLILPMNWAMRRTGMVSWVQAVTW
jgi:HK97 family phage prohead protease